jgi:hypothetical protein
VSGNENPTPSQVLAALLDHGADVQTYKGWDTKGRPWNYDGGGLRAIIMHHTATASASIKNPAPSLNWCANAYDRPAANMLVGKVPGTTYLLSAGSCWHSGDGGPFPAIGITRAANVGHFRMFGIEIDDPGLKVGTITDYQIEQSARIAAALSDLCGWPDLSRVITHGAWTDGSYGVNPNGPSPFKGRKNDTIAGPWGDYPGATTARDYNPIFWRQEVAKYVKKQETWDGGVPSRSVAEKAFADRKIANGATWRLACRLYDLGFRKKPSSARGKQTYPVQAMAAFQKSQGLVHTDGRPTSTTWRRLFGKDKP